MRLFRAGAPRATRRGSASYTSGQLEPGAGAAGRRGGSPLFCPPHLGRLCLENRIFAKIGIKKADMIKFIKSKVLWLVMGVVSLVSCLEDIENEYYPGTVPAVVCIYGDSAFHMLKTPLGMLYDESLSSKSEGDCLLASFTYNPNDPMNKDASARGYYYVTIEGTTDMSRLGTKSGLTDTTRVLANEVAVVPTAAIDFADYFVSLNQNLFVPVVYMALDGTTMTWELSYDPKQEPEMVDRLPVYSLYLRGIMSETSSETDEEEEEKPEEPKTFSDVVVFDMNAFLSDIKAHGAPSSGIQVRIRFLEGEDSSRPSGLLWGMTDPLLIN